MSQNPIETVEIVEPPIGELTKKHGGLKRGCFTGCGCIIFFIIAVVVAFRLFIGTGPQTLKKLPENFPADVPVYDRDNIDTITYISGTYKSRSMEIAGLFPKFILSPVLLTLDGNTTDKTQPRTNGATLEQLWKLITTPVGDNRDTIHVEWNTISAEPTFVISYYRTELRKQGYSTSDAGADGDTLTFEKGLVTGTLIVHKSTTDTSGLVYSALTINYPINLAATTTIYHAP